MFEAATEVIVARARRQERMTPMVVVSVVGHALAIAVLMLISLKAENEPPPKVFTVVLAGSPGPRSGGATAIGGRQVDRVAPDPPKAIETPPPVQPKMALPAPDKPKPTPPRPKPEATRKPAEAAVTPPSPRTGDQIQAGSTQVDTGARGTGFGLSSGGGSGGVQLDVVDFCCPEYVQLMNDRIREVWRQDQGGLKGTTLVRFTIHRDGSISGAAIERRSGLPPLDEAALRAVQLARLPRLPAQFTGQTLTVRLTFEYE